MVLSTDSILSGWLKRFLKCCHVICLRLFTCPVSARKKRRRHTKWWRHWSSEATHVCRHDGEIRRRFNDVVRTDVDGRPPRGRRSTVDGRCSPPAAMTSPVALRQSSALDAHWPPPPAVQPSTLTIKNKYLNILRKREPVDCCFEKVERCFDDVADVDGA